MEALETVPKRNITKALAYSNGLILHTSLHAPMQVTFHINSV